MRSRRSGRCPRYRGYSPLFVYRLYFEIVPSWGMAAKRDKRLEAMRANPRGDWRISDVKIVCHRHGILCEAARGGSSHFKVAHPQMTSKLSIPFARPIKPMYILALVDFIDAVEALS